MKARYSLPFRSSPNIVRCTARSHQGHDRHCVDFFMPLGTHVRAARAGVVVLRESRWNTRLKDLQTAHAGNGVLIRHSDGEISVYWHAAWRFVFVQKGQRVRRGQILFLSGDTGYATYPHLHFGVYAPNSGASIPIDFREALPPKVPASRYEGFARGAP